MSRKAQQLLGQIIIFVIGLAVIGGVLLFGYSVVKNFEEQKCDVQRVQFGTQLSSFLERNKGWGTNKVVRLDTPCETTHVCVVDRQFIDQEISATPSDFEDSSHELGVPGFVQRVIIASTGSSPANVFTANSEGQVLPVEKYVELAAPISYRREVTPGTYRNIACFEISGDVFEVQMVGTGRLVELGVVS